MTNSLHHELKILHFYHIPAQLIGRNGSVLDLINPIWRDSTKVWRKKPIPSNREQGECPKDRKTSTGIPGSRFLLGMPQLAVPLSLPSTSQSWGCGWSWCSSTSARTSPPRCPPASACWWRIPCWKGMDSEQNQQGSFQKSVIGKEHESKPLSGM